MGEFMQRLGRFGEFGELKVVMLPQAHVERMVILVTLSRQEKVEFDGDDLVLDERALVVEVVPALGLTALVEWATVRQEQEQQQWGEISVEWRWWVYWPQWRQ